MPLVLAFLLLLCLPTAVWAQPACSHWASPTGTGSSCAKEAPCKVASWWPLARPGGVLCLQDGTYTGADSMLAIPEDGFAGTPTQPIWVRAEHEGQVLIDGEDVRRPVDIFGVWGVIWGIDFTRGDNANIRFRGTAAQWKIQRFIANDTGKDGDEQVLLTGTNNLIEDFALFGPSRKQIGTGAGANGGSGNTARRGWARFESNLHPSSGPQNTFEMGYTEDALRYENLIGTYNLTGDSASPEGVVQVFATRNSWFLGSIFYVLPTDQFNAARVISGGNDGGSHLQQGNTHNTQNLLFRHHVALMHPSHPRFHEVNACRFVEDMESVNSPDGTGNVIDALVCVSGVPPEFSSGSWETPTHIQSGTSLEAAIGAGTSVWTASVAAPGICHRYVDGVLTSTPLWPFPMNQRLIDRMRAVGAAPVDVTATLEGLLGPIPAACRTGGTPDTTPPTVVLTAPTDGSLVSGMVAVTVEAADSGGSPIVRVLLDGSPVGQEHTGGSVSVLADSTQLQNGPHTLSATARDPAGNVATSAPVRILAYNGTRPPAPTPGPHPALHCHGALGAAGVIALVCQPQP